LEVVEKDLHSLTSLDDMENKLYNAITIQEIDTGEIMFPMMRYALVILIPYPLWSSISERFRIGVRSKMVER
jgi:hypothetical protein